MVNIESNDRTDLAEGVDISRFDHHAPELAVEGGPQTLYRQLRAESPIGWSDKYGGFWVASRYADVERVAKDSDTFSSALGINIPDLTDTLTDEDRLDCLRTGKGFAGPPVMWDRPAHTAIRRAMEPLFSPSAVREREAAFRAVADEWIDTFIGDGRCDVVAQYCIPVPSVLVLDWLGLPSADWKSWSDAVLSQFGTPGQYGPDISAIDLDAVIDTLHQRRAEPRPDIISAVARLEIDGEPLSDLEAMLMVAQLVFAGLDTTTNVAAGTIVELYRHPRLRDELAATPPGDPLWGSAVEEFLRFTVPVQGFNRTAKVDATVGIQAIRAAERVFILWASANFDEDEFPNPTELDIRRFPNRHMTFGRGIHRCLGSHVARLEITVMLQQLLARIPDYDIDESSLRLHPDVGLTYGYDTVPITFTLGDSSIDLDAPSATRMQA